MAATRAEIGFEGGQVLPVRLDDDQLKGLRDGLSSGSGWFEVSNEEGTVAIDLGKVIFVRTASSDQKIGF